MAELSELQAAVRAVRQSPHDTSAWQTAEDLAGVLDRPDDIVEAFRATVAEPLKPDVAEMVGERAGGFCDEWFGDDPAILEGILKRVFELAPQSDTTLQRLSVIYTVAERWNDLLALYDRALTAAGEKSRRIRLLREASQLAKDVANQPEKAIAYQQKLLPLTPDDAQLGHSLERLLERHERWADLIALWDSRLDGQSKRERDKSRARIASVWLDNLNDPTRALAAVRPLLAEAGEPESDADKDSCTLLARIIESPHAVRGIRDGALDLLRAHYDVTSRSRELIAVLQRVIAIDPAGSRALREEAGDRLADLDDLPGAMDHFAQLLALQPESSAVEEKLRQLADRSGDHARYARGVADAAGDLAEPTRAVELLSKAAKTRLDRLQDTDGAIALYEKAAMISGAAEQEQLIVVRRLNALYAQADRSVDRLMVLERQAALEPLDSTKNSLLSEAAKLAESLGQADRALALWEQRSDSDPADVSGLDARIALLESQGRWDDLVGTLENRAQKHGATAIGRADLVAVALVHEQKRHDLPAAIEVWQRVIVAAPNDADAVTALAGLFAQTARWREFADLISTATVREGSRTVERFVALGDAQRLHLGEPVAAAAAYRNAIAIDPNHEPALIGLRALLTEPTTRGAVADTLAATYARTGDVAAVLELLPARLAECEASGPGGGRDDKAELALLREAASLRLAHHGAAGRAAALADLARAFPLAPRDQMIEKQLLELGAATNDYITVALAFGEAISVLQVRGAAAQDPDVTRLRFLTADLLADQLADREAAANLYFDVATAMPHDRRAVAAVVSHGSELGRWGQVASTMLQLAQGSERFDDELWDLAQQTALARGHGEAFAHAIEGALDAVEVTRPVAAQFRYRLAQLRKVHLKDVGGAIVDLRRALELGGDRASWLSELAALERDGGPSKPLLDALRRQSEAEPTNLNVLVEAADVASHVGDREQAVAILSQVLARAATAWRGTTQLQSDRPYEAVATWATEGLVDLHRTAGRPRTAMDTLLDASRLPYDDATKRALRLRAADIATDELHDPATAIDMYRAVLAVAPTDRAILEKLASLLDAENRVGELLIIRQTQLANEADPERRLALRLETARLVGVIEATGGRLEALQANLQERPGHEASLNAVSALLTEKAQHRELSNLLEKQAVQVEGLGEPAQAARLWSRFADVAEKYTKEPERAIAGHRRVVALSPNPDSLRALARLNLERNQPAQAVPWLESLLTNVSGSERMAVVGQLARAHLAAKQPERAMGAIEQHLDPGEPAFELRQLLAELYRKNEQWEPLARHLTQSLSLMVDDQARRNAAREAATIYIEKLKQPARAIPALESALSIDPTDKDLRAQLAVGQRVSGKLPEARAALAELINDYGRRRSPERAVLHMELARVAQLEGKIDEAIAEMEQASKMDANNINSQKELAEITRAVGQLDKAERSYRALLLVVRRQPPGDDEAAVGQSEVLFELHKLAAQRGEAEQAKELLESALDAASQSDAEVRRFRRSLLAHNEGQLLLGVIEQRLKANTEAVGQSLLLSDMADVLLQLGRKDDALQAVIRATGLAPANTGLHEQARSLARDLGKINVFVDAAEVLADKLRRKDDPPLIADILMRAGLALEEDCKDLA
ncbi:MAG: tetratricopeptide repeat protein, partial [Kofleriaceae bacterium]|nr:tetratricopeptide repeat protein [Kofleriaceae bacterium]